MHHMQTSSTRWLLSQFSCTFILCAARIISRRSIFGGTRYQAPLTWLHPLFEAAWKPLAVISNKMKRQPARANDDSPFSAADTEIEKIKCTLIGKSRTRNNTLILSQWKHDDVINKNTGYKNTAQYRQPASLRSTTLDTICSQSAYSSRTERTDCQNNNSEDIKPLSVLISYHVFLFAGLDSSSSYNWVIFRSRIKSSVASRHSLIKRIS
ncbi:hypothetical protein K1T71_004586 [Dendrolimus kikuchii]|uniref:Uncharacterized protein n=1 Tax=Dendrolimus kikuchii TaxID=765133 RepID=A0ACC1D819_9NEOP|nr:hypothetical protein K1T71_004586 [Dendrolimus kikuchii]